MRALLPVLLLSSALVACRPQDVRTPDAYPLSGTLTGDWSGTHLRLVLIGTGVPGTVTNNSAVGQNVVRTGPSSWTYGFDLPQPGFMNVAGIYKVAAFEDANNNAALDLGEIVKANRRWLIVSPANADLGAVNLPDFLGGAEALPAMTLRRGWNVYDAAQPLSASNPAPFVTLRDYDLSR